MNDNAPRDQAWFERLYKQHREDVEQLLVRRLGSPHQRQQATELTQEVFMIAWRKRASVPEEAWPWLFTTANNQLRNHWRKTRTQMPAIELNEELLAGHLDPALATVDAIVDLRRAWQRLQPADQHVLLLAYSGKYNTDGELAAALGKKPAAAGKARQRARQRLERLMSEAEGPSVPRHRRKR